VYLNSLDTPFIFDDGQTVLLNPALATPWDLRPVVLRNIARPVVGVSYAVDAAFWGLTSFGFHGTNVLLHIVVVGLFYGFCTRALTDARPFGTKASELGLTPEWAAFFAATVVAVHPVMSSAVNYVSARSELLAAAAFLVALTFARRAIVKNKATAGWLAVLAGVLAVGSSSSAAVLPVAILGYDAWVLRDKGWVRRAVRYYVPAIVAIAIAIALRLPDVLALPRVPPRGVVTNLVGGAVVVWRYARLLLVPTGQSLVHEIRWPETALDPVGLLALAGIAAAIVMAVATRRERPLIALGLIWFAGVLAPATLVPVRDGMAEHRLYLASEGFLIAVASVSATALATRRLARIIASTVIVILGALTFQRNREWRDPMHLWAQAVERAPGAWQAHLGYAELLRDVRQCAAASNEYREVLRLNADNATALDGLDKCR